MSTTDAGFLTVTNHEGRSARINIVKGVDATLVDRRRVLICLLEDGNYFLRLGNPPDSGRTPLTETLLSPESFFGILAVGTYFAGELGLDPGVEIAQALGGDEVDISVWPLDEEE